MILTAYNGTQIENYGSIDLCCKSEHTDWVECKFHVAETPGPAILGLPSYKSLKLVTLHCSVGVQPQTETPHIKSIQDLMTVPREI